MIKQACFNYNQLQANFACIIIHSQCINNRTFNLNDKIEKITVNMHIVDTAPSADK